MQGELFPEEAAIRLGNGRVLAPGMGRKATGFPRWLVGVVARSELPGKLMEMD